jgi:hypothetical protein
MAVNAPILNYPEDNTLHQQHGESLKTKILNYLNIYIFESAPEIRHFTTWRLALF